MPAGLKRQLEGGRAADWAWRREQRGAGGLPQAPSWSAEAADAFLVTLNVCHKDDGSKSIGVQLLMVLQDGDASDRLMAALPSGTSASARRLIAQIVFHHSNVAAQQGLGYGVYDSAAKTITHRCLKPLRDKARARTKAAPLVLAEEPYTNTFHEYLTGEVQHERLRSIEGNNRIRDGVAAWDLSWLEAEGVVCYERAAGRVRDERPGSHGSPAASFLRGVVSTDVLPTAVANGADHYVVVSAARPPRFMTVEEVSRSMGVPPESPVMVPLTDETFTAIQAVAALGEAVHVGVVRRLVRRLLEAGVLARGATYGSAYSGVDLVAAALEAELGADWSHVFAAEADERKRLALGRAWGGRGLRWEAIAEAAEGPQATTAPAVDLWSLTASCKPHSARNHSRCSKEQWASVAEVHRSLDYARLRRPRAIIVENVAMPSVVEPLTTVLEFLPGYRWETAVLDPRWHAGAATARERQYWLGVRAS